MGPSQTMSVAEHLYTHGYISYPRTETTAYPSSFDFHFVLKQLKSGQYSDVAQQIMDEGIHKPKSGENKGKFIILNLSSGVFGFPRSYIHYRKRIAVVRFIKS